MYVNKYWLLRYNLTQKLLTESGIEREEDLFSSGVIRSGRRRRCGQWIVSVIYCLFCLVCCAAMFCLSPAAGIANRAPVRARARADGRPRQGPRAAHQAQLHRTLKSGTQGEAGQELNL